MGLRSLDANQLATLDRTFDATPEHEVAEDLIHALLAKTSVRPSQEADQLSSSTPASGVELATPASSTESRVRPAGTLSKAEAMCLSRTGSLAIPPSATTAPEPPAPFELLFNNGDRLPRAEALAAGLAFLGADYVHRGAGRFVSADGLRQLRMGDGDLSGWHSDGPHLNFEFLEPNPDKPGKMRIVRNLHLFLETAP